MYEIFYFVIRTESISALAGQTITLTLGKNVFAFWDEGSKSWKVNKGNYTIYIGESSRDISKVYTINIK